MGGGQTIEAVAGAEIPALSVTPDKFLTARYAGASGDFNPMHTDEVKAKEAGLPSVFGHGMFSAGFLATAITNYVGVGNLTRYRVRFAKQTWPGETFVTKVKVTGKRKENGAHLVDLECTLVNQDGEVKVAGEATVNLPTRG